MATRKQITLAQRRLRKIGFPITVDGRKGSQTKRALKDFKRGFALWKTPLAVHAGLGRRTRKALGASAKRGGKCSPHFYYRDFRSKGDGWIRCTRYHVKALEKLRDKVGPIGILSGYRDPDHNASVGGAKYSQHVRALAIDPMQTRITLAQAKSVKRFSGIGMRGDQAAHLDCRHRGKWNFFSATPRNPTVYSY